ncbi:MAG TPA: hypothetical protein DEV78_03250 [Clostridiales bacterium]|nr:hypothetical protein [Clostridiales bacterium]
MVWWAILLIALGAVIVLGAVGIVAWWISTYNKFVKMKNDVEEAYSTMDVYMKKRYDLIPNLVETVKGYAKHEKEALESVMKARYSCMSANTQEEKAQSENWLAGTLKTLFSVAENYPELKANANYISMMNSLQTIEAEIASSRKYYNGAVKVYNTKREVFPANIVARHYNFEKKVLFEIDNVEERKAPKVEF